MTSVPPFDLYSYEPPVSLWSLISSAVPIYEHEEIKNLLGISLVEQSIELHQEINSLLAIWREFRLETANREIPTPLPEPPATRERLTHEIRFFVESIREKAQSSGRVNDHLLAKYNQNVLDYALDERRSVSSGFVSRPSTARSSRTDCETPLFTPTSDRLSYTSTISEKIESINENLNVMKFDEVRQHLRESLQEEIDKLHSDITFLQECLEEEADYRFLTTPENIPTLTDLRSTRTSLEKDLLSEENSPNVKTPTNENKYFTTGENHSKESLQKSLRSLCSVATDETAHVSIHTNQLNKLSKNSERLPSKTHLCPIKTFSSPVNGSKCADLCKISSKNSKRTQNCSKETGGRSSSAQKFRSMVIQCRDTS